MRILELSYVNSSKDEYQKRTEVHTGWRVYYGEKIRKMSTEKRRRTGKQNAAFSSNFFQPLLFHFFLPLLISTVAERLNSQKRLKKNGKKSRFSLSGFSPVFRRFSRRHFSYIIDVS